MQGKLTKLAGHPHCCNCANVRDTKHGHRCHAEMWKGALIMPESVSMSWDWGVWDGDVFVGFVKEYGCQSYAPAEHHKLEYANEELKWAATVDVLHELAVQVDTMHGVDRELLERYDRLDAKVQRLAEELHKEKE